MAAYTKPQQRKNKESERLRGEREIGSSLLILDLKSHYKYPGSGEYLSNKVLPNTCLDLNLKN